MNQVEQERTATQKKMEELEATEAKTAADLAAATAAAKRDQAAIAQLTVQLQAQQQQVADLEAKKNPPPKSGSMCSDYLLTLKCGPGGLLSSQHPDCVAYNYFCGAPGTKSSK